MFQQLQLILTYLACFADYLGERFMTSI